MIKFPTPDGSCEAYVSFPKGKKNLPIVLLYMDAIGLRPRIQQMADRISEQGYYVLAPNLYYRKHLVPVVDYDFLLKPDNIPELMRQVLAMAAELNPELSKRDTQAFLDFARGQPEVNPKKVGAVGYCMGGGQVLRAAGNFPDDIQAAASFHAGNLATDLETSPSHWFGKIKAEVYIGHADHDKVMQPDQQARVRQELETAGLKHKTELYKGCLHGWTMADLPVSNPEGEEKHWTQLFDLFERNLTISSRS